MKLNWLLFIFALRLGIASQKLASSWYNKACDLEKNGKHEDALEAFHKTLEVNQDADREWDILDRIAKSLSLAKRWGDASTYFAMALQTHPGLESGQLKLLRELVDLLRNRGNALLNAYKDDEEREAYEVALESFQAAAKLAQVAGALDLHFFALGDLVVGCASLETFRFGHNECFEKCDQELESFLDKVGDPSAGKVEQVIYVAMLLEKLSLEMALRCMEFAKPLAYEFFEKTNPLLASFLYHLGRIYKRKGEFIKEKDLYEEAVHKHAVWKNVWQRPGYVFPGYALEAKPWWRLPENPVPEELAEVINLLEAGFHAIREEVVAELGFLDKEEIFQPDAEGISRDSGKWHLAPFHRHGRSFPETRRRFPRTTEILDHVLLFDLARDLPRGSVELSVLSAGAILVPHCGPTNHRLRLHLPLWVPQGEPPRMRVGQDPFVACWREGTAVVFDDSFEHEVEWERAEKGLRVVLMVDLWHPGLEEEGKSIVRAHFARHDSYVL